MSKIFSLLLVISLILGVSVYFSGCEKADNTSEPTSQPSNSNVSDTSSTGSETNSTVESQPETSKESDTTTDKKPENSTPTQTQPTVLNPKTDLKLDQYFSGEFLITKKDTYTKINIAFHNGGDDNYSYDYSASPYFSKERCTEIYQGWGSTFNEADFNANQIVTVNGVKYYYIDGYGGGTAHNCEFTDKIIKLYDDEAATTELSLRTDGSLVVDVAITDMFGIVGTKFVIE